MALHCTKDRYDVAIGDWWLTLFIDPPAVECLIWVDKEPLFLWWCFSKCIGDVYAVNKHVLCGRYCIEDAQASSVNAVCICVIKDPYLAGTRRPITNTSSFLASVQFLNHIRPNKVKYSGFIFRSNWVIEHELFIILVKLEVFRFVPISPVVLFHKFAPGEFHHLRDNIPNIAINYDILSWSLREIVRRVEC